MNINKPLVFYALSFFIGSLSSLIFRNSLIIGAVVAASFLYVIYFTNTKMFTLINATFVLCGIISFNMYFYFLPSNCEKIRVVEVKRYCTIGKLKGRNILLKGNTKNLKEGRKIKAKGKFQKNIIYDKGIIGNYFIDEYENCNEDFIYNCYCLKERIKYEFSKRLDDNKKALVMSLCFGDTSLLTIEEKNKFQKLGVIHAVSVSGFHLSIVYKILEILGGVKLGIILSFLYVVFTGLRYSTLRAFIMIVILKFSKIVYKNYDSISAISLAFLLILFIKPYSFMEIGFMLSFLSTLGIILYYNKIRKKLYYLPSKINDSLSITLSAQIFTLPYIAFTLEDFSLGFIIGNLFLLPLYSVVIIVGNFALLAINFKFLFSVINILLYNLTIGIEGANYILLKICPPMINLGGKEGICLIIIYFSYVMIKYGKKQFKYLPVMAVTTLFISYYTIFPEIYIINDEKMSSAIIKYNINCLMICNYDLEKGKDVIKLKEKYNVNKIITNKEDSIVITTNNSVVKIIDDDRKINSIAVKNIKGKYIYYDIIDRSQNKEILYKIIFGKVYKKDFSLNGGEHHLFKWNL
ncbi:competence protein ComEC [Clostridium tetanomorphum]|uniref:ComEC/Rec2 family competence protein n=1 Tax=Clostridium tetanomorphum TaxID=1553 RepID=A0A923E8U1_CLOTT|nr:ComEC/Rec2 family competence protein [Clostridium tetanomorphum]KAJ53843.1 integral membrane protein comE [Clostridium tetanomorphum DSM 665]MBC2397357.1 ComEC/Rec2 family competence protein [Clostridium tetanomorphum]MBP1862577.1 competence protein ComEC [Clostridium tetanomorphum]NRS85582.1 competence protein ComEC [Clostridium tetanomorphum]NRZ96407.1 competence protein ComEC [Clostridium tetanomorphum]